MLWGTLNRGVLPHHLAKFESMAVATSVSI